MNRDEIIMIAKEAGLPIEKDDEGEFIGCLDFFDREELVRRIAKIQRERMKWDGLHSCHSECDRPACVNMRKAVEAEREACIEWCAAYASDDGTAQKIIAAIRARGSNV
jgi:hypothetical protein